LSEVFIKLKPELERQLLCKFKKLPVTMKAHLQTLDSIPEKKLAETKIVELKNQDRMWQKQRRKL
jgi:hypothetical protein